MISNNGVETMYYGYADNQSSLIALTDENGTVVEKYAYDPLGARRNPTDWTQKDNRTSWITNRGYTGHEHLDAFGIINMNGRVYDPSTAQFFSPDPFIQSGGDWINYNRYGYCFDNPLTNTDPSGYVKEPNDDGYVPKLMPANCYYYGSQIYRGYNSGFTYGGTSSPYTYDWHTGNYNDSQGNIAAYWEVSNNYIQSNSTRATSDQIITALNTVQSGQKFYSVQFGSGFTSYATSYGDIGNATVSSNGGLNFSNPTAAMTSLSFWEGGSGEGKSLSDFVGLAGTVGELIGSGAKSILDDRGTYMPKGSIYKADIPITIRTSFLNINSTSKVLNYARIGGKVLVVAGVVTTGYQVINDGVNGNYYSAGARLAVAGVAAGAAFIPVVGWAVAEGIGVADFIWGEQFYNYVQTNLGD